MSKKRPVYLNLLQIKFPIMAIVSILHRISGFFLFLTVPILLWALNDSLDSKEGFSYIKDLVIYTRVGLFFSWIILSIFVFHLIAGIRHLLMDWGWFESLKTGKQSSIIVFVVFFIFIILLGVWLW